MKSSDSTESFRIAREYLHDHFESTDRLAVVVLDTRTRFATQRLAGVEAIASPDFQAWLRHKNAQRCEIYVSMNALHPSARGRQKADVQVVRHVYLDVDRNGADVVKAILSRPDVPNPTSVITSSPDKRQVVWRVQGFER